MAKWSQGIHGNAMYNTNNLREIGIGDVELMRARQAGVKPRKIGKWYWYHGQELIDWMLNRSDIEMSTVDPVD